jgi:hypothetical protein
MNPTTSVDLPTVESTDTIGTAIDRLKAAGKSGVVVDMGQFRYVVLEDQSLRNSLIATFDNRDVPVGKVAAIAFLPPERGAFSFGSSRPVTGLARQQRNYAVTRLKDGTATVTTSQDRADRLTQPSTLFDDDAAVMA